MLRHLVLLGLGSTHRALLARLGRHLPADLAVTLVTRQRTWVERDVLLRKVALRQPLEGASHDVQALTQHSGIRLVTQPVLRVEAAQNRLHLADGQHLDFDWLSIELEPTQSRDLMAHKLPGARTNALFAHPLEDLVRLWPRVQQLADSRPLRFAVIGSDASSAEVIQALEWAFALREAWPQAAISCVAGTAALNWASNALQTTLRDALARSRITLLADTACRVEPDELHLASGARLACDMSLLAGPVQAPGWLAPSDVLPNQADHAITPVSRFEHVLLNQTGGSARRLESDVLRLLRGQPPLRATETTRKPLIIRTGAGTGIVEAWGMIWGRSRAAGRIVSALLGR